MSWKGVAVAAAGLTLAYAAGRAAVPAPVEVTVTREVPPQALLDSLHALELEAHGLRAKLAGRVELRPRTVLRTDTVFRIPDSVILAGRVNGAGQLDLGVGAVQAGGDTLRVPVLAASILQGVNVGRCDDGWSFDGAGRVVCDRARLGRAALEVASAIVLVGGQAPTTTIRTGVAWSPYLRSPWVVSAGLALSAGQPPAGILEVRRKIGRR